MSEQKRTHIIFLRRAIDPVIQTRDTALPAGFH